MYEKARLLFNSKFHQVKLKVIFIFYYFLKACSHFTQSLVYYSKNYEIINRTVIWINTAYHNFRFLCPGTFRDGGEMYTF